MYELRFYFVGREHPEVVKVHAADVGEARRKAFWALRMRSPFRYLQELPRPGVIIESRGPT